MKWFKHITDSLDDPFVVNLMRKYKHKGYTVFFGMIEIVARECRNFDSYLTLSYHFCGRKLSVSCQTLNTILQYIATTGRFEFCDKGEYFLIRIPKLSELKDNYSKDKLARGLQETFPPLQSKITEEDKEKEEEPPTPLQFLVNTWKSKNKKFAHASPKMIGHADSAISAALTKGMTSPEIETIIWETAGQNVEPWKLFDEKRLKEIKTKKEVDERARLLKEING